MRTFRGSLEVKMSSGSGVRDPHFEISRTENMREREREGGRVARGLRSSKYESSLQGHPGSTTARATGATTTSLWRNIPQYRSWCSKSNLMVRRGLRRSKYESSSQGSTRGHKIPDQSSWLTRQHVEFNTSTDKLDQTRDCKQASRIRQPVAE